MGNVLTVFPPLVVFVSGNTVGRTHFKNPARGTCPAMAATPLFRATGEGVTAKAPATTAAAAEGDVRAMEGGSGAEAKAARAKETARMARQGDDGALCVVFFFRG